MTRQTTVIAYCENSVQYVTFTCHQTGNPLPTPYPFGVSLSTIAKSGCFVAVCTHTNGDKTTAFGYSRQRDAEWVGCGERVSRLVTRKCHVLH